MSKSIQLTKQGFETLEAELATLLNVKRPRLVERLANARSQGDLSENSDYTNAKEELEFMDGRIDELGEVIKNAVIVTCQVHSNDISVGAKVTLKNNGSTTVFELVGEWEADPLKKKISPMSLLGKALLGKKVGDRVAVEAPVGKVEYEVLAIN